MGALAERFPDLLPLYEARYPGGTYGPSLGIWQGAALRIKELSENCGIRDRKPRVNH